MQQSYMYNNTGQCYCNLNAFGDCDKLKRISDWTKWYQIRFSGSSGFHGDLYINGKKLTEAVIPKGETEVKGGPISGITSIKKVTIPDTVLCIGSMLLKTASTGKHKRFRTVLQVLSREHFQDAAVFQASQFRTP